MLFRDSKKDGGAEEIRTPDPHNAIVVLYQLSYDPIQSEAQFRGLTKFVKTDFAARRLSVKGVRKFLLKLKTNRQRRCLERLQA
jgi:hypothetical protein